MWSMTGSSCRSTRALVCLLAAALVLLGGCASIRPGELEPRVDATEMAVYQVVLRSLSDHLSNPRIAARTIDLPEGFPSLGVWFEGACTSAGTQPPSIPSRPARRVPRGASWSIPTSSTSGQTVQFSRVGFDETGGRAAVYVVISCGDLCGWGDVFLLEKRDERWSVGCSSTLWES